MQYFTSDCSNIEVYFTPGNDCTGKIIDTINGAQKSILIQAYEFTSEPIVHSVIQAYRRSVDVKIILGSVDIYFTQR